MTSPEQRLAELGITLPDVPKPRWAYSPFVRSGNLVFVSGQIATEDGRILHPGKLGREVDVVAGQEAARGTAIAALAVARQAAGGSLDNVVRVVKLTVFVSSADGFGEQPTVANGASEFLRDATPVSAPARPSASPSSRSAPVSKPSSSSRCGRALRATAKSKERITRPPDVAFAGLASSNP